MEFSVLVECIENYSTPLPLAHIEDLCANMSWLKDAKHMWISIQSVESCVMIYVWFLINQVAPKQCCSVWSTYNNLVSLESEALSHCTKNCMTSRSTFEGVRIIFELDFHLIRHPNGYKIHMLTTPKQNARLCEYTHFGAERLAEYVVKLCGQVMCVFPIR